MIFGVLESFNDSPLLLYLAVISIACIGGGIPPMLERRRRRSIENQLPTFLEALSDSVGAGRGLQEAMMEQSESNDGLLASLLAETLKEAHASSFEASLQAFAAKTRSSQVQRDDAHRDRHAAGFISARHSDRFEQGLRTPQRPHEPARDRTLRSWHAHHHLCERWLTRADRLHCRTLCSASKGFQITAFNQTFSLFFAAASAVAVGVSGRMMGRLKDTLWWLPMWMAISMGLYLGAVKAVGG